MSSEPSNQAIKNDPSIKPLRTFKTDAEEAVRYQNVSAIDIAVAEQKKKEEKAAAAPVEYADVKKPRKSAFALIVAALALVAVGAGGYYYWTTRSATEMDAIVAPSEASNQTVREVTVETIIPYQSGKTILIPDGSDPLDLIGQALASARPNKGETFVLVPTQGATSTSIAKVADIFAGTDMPAGFKRSLGTDYMFGSYAGNSTGPFIILTNTFFQNAFAGMLDWEKDMRNDLISLIQAAHPAETTIATDSDIFQDDLVSNIDIRVLLGKDGKPILAYAFADTETTVIAASIETLKHVLDRLLSVRTIQ